MKFIETELNDCYIIEPAVYGDQRGYFMESFNQKGFDENIRKTHFVQDNESQSSYGVVRGLHYQLAPYAQSKLVRVIQGKVLDIAVDIRKGSPSFAKHIVVELSDENKRQLFVPRGFAHGFIVLSEKAIFQYKVDNNYAPDYEAGIAFDDPSLNIDWRIPREKLVLSDKDLKNPKLSEAQLFDYNHSLY